MLVLKRNAFWNLDIERSVYFYILNVSRPKTSKKMLLHYQAENFGSVWSLSFWENVGPNLNELKSWIMSKTDRRNSVSLKRTESRDRLLRRRVSSSCGAGDFGKLESAEVRFSCQILHSYLLLLPVTWSLLNQWTTMSFDLPPEGSA